MHSSTGFRPSKKLMELIKARHWAEVRYRSLSHPWDARYRNARGKNTALHQACLYRAPLDVIRLVLHAFPPALVQTNDEGWTPLHVALLYGNSDDVVLELIARGKALLVQSDSAQHIGSPLNVACRHGASTTVIKALLETSPHSALYKTDQGTQAVHLLWHHFQKRQKLTPMDLHQEETVLQRLALLLRAARGKPLLQPGDPSLHDAMLLVDAPPEGLLQLLIRVHPDQCRWRDQDGNLALHVAAARQGITPHVLADILNTYPPAVGIPDALGRLPLHVALTAGKRQWNSGIAALVQAAPGTLEQPNGLTHLYPAQEAHDVETIYQLVLAWPPLVKQ